MRNFFADHRCRERDLLEPVRLILGLWEAGLSPAAIAVLVQDEALVKDVMTTDHHAIERIKSLGLRHSVGLPHGKALLCRLCHSRISYVPCVSCSRSNRTESAIDAIDAFEQDAPLKEPECSTEAMCGSSAKIEVMMMRIERGESCFHADDSRDRVNSVGRDSE